MKKVITMNLGKSYKKADKIVYKKVSAVFVNNPG